MNCWHEKPHVFYIMHLVSYFSYLTPSHQLKEGNKNIFLLIMNGGCAGGKIEKNEMGRACGMYGGGVHKVLVGKPEGKRPMGRPRRRWEDNIKMDLQELGGACGDWMELAQDRDRCQALVSTVMNLRVPKMRGIS